VVVCEREEFFDNQLEQLKVGKYNALLHHPDHYLPPALSSFASSF
jgi:hypothetical protein